MTEYVCTKIGQTDEASAAACQLFLRRRYQMIWDSALWKESLSSASVTVPDYTNVCTMPLPSDQVVALRRGACAVTPLDPATLTRLHPGAWTATGGAVGFAMEAPSCLLKPAWQAGELEEPCEAYTVASATVADNTQLLTLTGTGLGPAGVGSPRPVRETLALRGTVPVATVYSYVNVASAVLSAVCAGELHFTSSRAETVAQLEPGDLTLPSLPRFRIFGARAGEVYSVLFKRAPIDLRNNADEPEMRTCTNTLLAFATGDMLERQRQYGKAQALMQEAGAQLRIMLDLERNQSAGEQRIVPGEVEPAGWGGGFGENGKGYW